MNSLAIEKLIDQKLACACFAGCANCSNADKQLWLLRGHGFCGATTKAGKPCTQQVDTPSDTCYLHKGN